MSKVLQVARYLLVIGACAALFAAPAIAYIEVQDFYNAPSDWTSRANTDGTYTETMEWSSTNLAGGGVGEAHVKFHRIKTADDYNDNVSYYADTDLGGTLDVAALRILTASGKFCIDDFTDYPDFGNGINLGWFRPGGKCRMGIMLNDNGGPGAGWYARIVDNLGNIVANQFMGSVAKDTRYTFEMEFDNLEGVYGNGRLVVKLTPEGGETETATLHLENKLSNYEFSAFGLARANPFSVANPQTSMDIYLDDARYTSNVMPYAQPSAMEYQYFDAPRADWTIRALSGGGYSEIIEWSNTNYAGISTGEGHGKFFRLHSTTDSLSDCVSWYADTDLGGPLDVTTTILAASGKFYIKDHAADPDLGTGVWIGWFRPGGAARIGIFINNNHAANAAGWYAGIVDNGGNVVASQYIGSIAMGVKHSFEIEFNNRDGEYGKGRLVAKVTPEGGSTETCLIHLQNFLTQYEFSAFGMARPNPSLYDPYNYKAIDMYLDDLAYSSNIAGEIPATPIHLAKMTRDNQQVVVKGFVSAVFFEGYFYVQNENGSGGIRVLKANHDAGPGDEVVVIGVMSSVTIPGERYIAASTVEKTGNTKGILPVAMNLKNMGGGDYNYDALTGTGQKGVDAGYGLNNIGLLVRVVGRASYIDDGSFMLDDGSGVPVTVRCPFGSSPWSNPYVVVVGISSCEKDANENLQRVLLAKPDANIEEITP